MAEEINRQSALAKAQRNADKALREAYSDEWNGLMQKAAAAEGIKDWAPRKTAEQKAEEDLQRLLSEFPHLADKIKTDGVI